MPITGIFYLPIPAGGSSQTQEILNRLTSYYNPMPLPPWSLSHRLFRETPTGAPSHLEKGKPSEQRYLQVLALSYHVPRTYVAITSTNAPSQTQAATPASSDISGAEPKSGDPASMISIPPGPQSEEFLQLVMSKLGPLWQQRQTLNVSHGHTFEVGDFWIRVGELRQGGGGSTQGERGTVVEVQWNGGEDGEDDWESAEAIVGSFWDGLGVRGAKKVFWVPGLRAGDGSVAQWCEILRIRT